MSLDSGKDWQRVAEFPRPAPPRDRGDVGGKIYALGGDYGHDKTQIDVASCQRVDPVTKKWSEIASLQQIAIRCTYP